MDVIVTGSMAMEKAALQQVCLSGGARFVHGHRKVVVALSMGAFHSGDNVTVAAPDIGPAALPFEKVNTRRGHNV